MLRFVSEGDEFEIGDEIAIETDGKELIIDFGEVRFRKSYDSVLEILGIMMWLMKNVQKTTVVFKDGEQEFVRKRKYRGYKAKIRL